MDSFGTWAWQKWKLIFFLVNAEFYRVVWTINALLTVRSKMLPFLGNNQNITYVWSPPPPPPPEHFAIGYVHNDKLPLGNIALQYYVIPNNSRKVWWCFLMISYTFWRSRFFSFEFTKTTYLVALIINPIITSKSHMPKPCSLYKLYYYYFFKSFYNSSRRF